jgi:hypothetical protein
MGSGDFWLVPGPPFRLLKHAFQTAGTPVNTCESPGLGHDWATIFTRDRTIAARTRFAGMPVIARCSEAGVFELIVSLGYRECLLAWLTAAALEF